MESHQSSRRVSRLSQVHHVRDAAPDNRMPVYAKSVATAIARALVAIGSGSAVEVLLRLRAFQIMASLEVDWASPRWSLVDNRLALFRSLMASWWADIPFARRVESPH